MLVLKNVVHNSRRLDLLLKIEGVKAKRKEANHRYRLKNESKIQEQDKERRMLWRLKQKCSKDKEAYEEHKRKDREREND